MIITEKPAETSPSVAILAPERPKPKPPSQKPVPIEPEYNYHRQRKLIHAICVVIFFTLPLSSLMRFDIPRQRFYFFGSELWISEFAIIFFSLMFCMFVIAAMAMFWGRVYCSYLCPQMIFSEASIALEDKIARMVNKRISWSPGKKKLLGKAIFYVLAALASVVLAFVFISYFVEPRDLFHRLMSLDIQTAGGFAGATVTSLTLLDFLFVRLRFCTVCPYGYLEGMLTDSNTLIVHYRDPDQQCIECAKCVRVCQMGIDIRKSPYQIECTHCGECIDACSDVLARLGKPGLIHYTWGEKGEKFRTGRRPWHQRIGFRDAKRGVVLLIVLFYATGLYVAISMRREVLVEIAPMRDTLYRRDSQGAVYNRFHLKAANRSSRQQTVVLAIDGLTGVKFASFENAVVVTGGQTLEREFEIAAPPLAPLQPGVNHFRLLSRVGNESSSSEQTFIMPYDSSR